MSVLMTATLSSKAQLTLPRRIRELLGVGAAGDQVGFLVNERTHRILLTPVAVMPADAPYTNAELRKLFRLAKSRKGKTFESAEAFLTHLHRL